MKNPEILTVEEVAEVLKVSRTTIFRWKTNEGLPYLKIGDRTLRFDREAVLKWAKEQAILSPEAKEPEISPVAKKEKRWKHLVEMYHRFFVVSKEVPKVLFQQLTEMLEIDWSLIKTGELEVVDVQKQMIDDPLFAFVSFGVTLQGPETEPIFYSALRQPPTQLIFALEAEKYILTIYVDGEEAFTEEMESTQDKRVILKWPEGIQVTSGKKYIWSVQPIIADSVNEEDAIAGLFWLVPEAELKVLDVLETQCAHLKDESIRAVALATLYQNAHLYDEGVRHLLNVIDKHPRDPKVIPVRRALGNIYHAMHSELLSEDLRIFDNALDWLSERGREQLMLIYCLLLDNYDRYERGECEACNECGLIR